MPPAPQKTAAPNPDPDKDAKDLVKQGADRPKDGDAKAPVKPDAPSANGSIGAKPGDVYAEDWWTHARPTFEFHGYLRVRTELWDHFSLGRKDLATTALWPQPADTDYIDSQGPRIAGGQSSNSLCGDTPEKPKACDNNTQAGANMRFRLNPELHISDNLRVMAQIDLLDNLVPRLTAAVDGNPSTAVPQN